LLVSISFFSSATFFALRAFAFSSSISAWILAMRSLLAMDPMPFATMKFSAYAGLTSTS